MRTALDAPNGFGELLRRFRTRSGLSQAQLAEHIGRSRYSMISWENEQAAPERDTIIAIGTVLGLPREGVNVLLESARYARLSESEYTVRSVIVTGEPVATSVQVVYSPMTDSIHELQAQVKDIQSAIEALDNRIGETPSTELNDESFTLNQEMRNLRATLSQLQVTSQELSAPVVLPSSQDMEVRLVASTSLEQLEEYREEQNKWFSWLGFFAGGVLGVVVNLVTGGVIESEGWILVATCLLMGGWTGWTASQYKRRGDRLKAQILSSKRDS